MLPIRQSLDANGVDQVAEIGGYADGVVVGSALVNKIADAGSSQAAVVAAAQFVEELKRPLR